MDIRIKTTGMLIDELFTTKMKIIANPTKEHALRASLLEEAIADRVGCRMFMIDDLCRSLQDILKSVGMRKKRYLHLIMYMKYIMLPA